MKTNRMSVLIWKTDCSTQNFTFLKHLISKTDFTAIKYSGQGSIKAKKGTIDKLLFLLKETKSATMNIFRNKIFSF